MQARPLCGQCAPADRRYRSAHARAMRTHRTHTHARLFAHALTHARSRFLARTHCAVQSRPHSRPVYSRARSRQRKPAPARGSIAHTHARGLSREHRPWVPITAHARALDNRAKGGNTIRREGLGSHHINTHLSRSTNFSCTTGLQILRVGSHALPGASGYACISWSTSPLGTPDDSRSSRLSPGAWP